jgi:hypothetical protein
MQTQIPAAQDAKPRRHAPDSRTPDWGFVYGEPDVTWGEGGIDDYGWTRWETSSPAPETSDESEGEQQ